MLYIVPTPIGNLEDITLRALRILREADLVLAEDTRHSGILLHHYGIETKMTAYHQHNEHQLTTGLVQRLKSGESMALISDAGTPGISDAAFLLIRACLREHLDVCCLPGATALIPALLLSGFPADEFLFVSFLPQKKGRRTRLQQLALEPRTIILYESPNRIQKLLDELNAIFGPQRHLAISRELTKIHEETLRGSVEDLKKKLTGRELKGEVVVVIEGHREEIKKSEIATG